MIAAKTHQKEWLKPLPNNWDVLRIKNIFTEVDERSETGKEELLSVSHYTGITKKRDALDNEDDMVSNAKTLVGYKKVTQKDLVSNIMLAWNGSLGISKYNGITSPAYCVYRIKGNNNPDYYGYLFSTEMMKGEFRKKSYGIIDSRLRLYSDKFFSITAPVPSIEEQNNIVEYIDAQTKKIKTFISKKQTFINLLKEQKQSVIDELLVNKGEKVKIKYCVSKIGGGVTPRGGATVYKDSGIMFLRSQNIYNDRLHIGNVAYITEEIHSSMKGSQVKKNDVLINVTGGSIGRCFTYLLDDEANINQHVTIIRPDLSILIPKFLMLQLQSDRIQHQIDMIEGASREGLTKGDISNYYLYLPSKEEQAQIIKDIKTETSIIDQAISTAEKEIELIKEYQKAMIAEAVLGKVKKIKTI